jgi:hypothetical protein
MHTAAAVNVKKRKVEALRLPRRPGTSTMPLAPPLFPSPAVALFVRSARGVAAMASSPFSPRTFTALITERLALDPFGVFAPGIVETKSRPMSNVTPLVRRPLEGCES